MKETEILDLIEDINDELKDKEREETKEKLRKAIVELNEAEKVFNLAIRNFERLKDELSS